MAWMSHFHPIEMLMKFPAKYNLLLAVAWTLLPPQNRPHPIGHRSLDCVDFYKYIIIAL